jgi:hypothetical protein
MPWLDRRKAVVRTLPCPRSSLARGPCLGAQLWHRLVLVLLWLPRLAGPIAQPLMLGREHPSKLGVCLRELRPLPEELGACPGVSILNFVIRTGVT